MAAFCYVLSAFAIFKMPFGGSVTLAHTLPLLLLSFKSGYKNGGKAALVFVFMKFIFNFHAPPAQVITSYVAVIFLDYILPYFLIGISSLYLKIFKRELHNIVFSVIVTELIRFVFAVISGVLVWNDYFEYDIKFLFYCCLYNLTYMIPNLVISLIIARLIYKDFKRIKSDFSHTF